MKWVGWWSILWPQKSSARDAPPDETTTSIATARARPNHMSRSIQRHRPRAVGKMARLAVIARRRWADYKRLAENLVGSMNGVEAKPETRRLDCSVLLAIEIICLPIFER